MILRYENLNYEQISGLNRGQTIVFIPCGPLEQHGPHLPLGVDAFSAQYFAEQSAERMKTSPKYSQWSFILYPTIYLGADVFSHLGSLEIRPRTLRAVLSDVVGTLAKNGFKNIVLIGAHGGPRHMVVLEEVAARARWRWRAKVICASSKIITDVLRGRFAERIEAHMKSQGDAMTDQERSAVKKDFHGGFFETSLMLLARPELVNQSYKTLSPAVLENVWKMRKHSLKTISPGLGYLGFPSLARPAFAKSAVAVLLDETIPWVERYFAGEKVEKKFRSFLYYVPFLRTDFSLILVMLVY
ncbi:MAG TPA: creatininase family protein, partial [Oligoflexia bacterium]|nr:creatininase family protein [Oligoflexia bacterium]